MELIACHDCDLLHRCVELPPGGAARCTRCRGVLYREKRDSLDRTLALAVAGLVLFIVANSFPFLSFAMKGNVTVTTLATGVVELYRQGRSGIATLVLLTSIAAPAVQLTLLLYVLAPLKFNRRPPWLARAFRMLRHIQPWSMMEIFLLGILVSLVKLAKMADVVPGLALWSFGLLIVALAGAVASLDPRIVWRRVDAAR